MTCTYTDLDMHIRNTLVPARPEPGHDGKRYSPPSRSPLCLLFPVFCSPSSLPLPAGCGGAPASKTVRIGFIPKLINIPYFNACKKGAEQAAQELGVELLYNGPTSTDTNFQIDLVNQWAASHRIDALCIACNDPDLIARTLQDARGKGLAVITYDADS